MRSIKSVTPLIALFFTFTLLWPYGQGRAQSPGVYDLVIMNGRIVDGSGNPWFRGDIGIVGDRITKIGHLGPSRAVRRIDAQGMIVAPGFIDMLGQSELNLLIDPRAESKVFQGITTEVTGEGGSIAPVNDYILKETQPLL